MNKGAGVRGRSSVILRDVKQSLLRIVGSPKKMRTAINGSSNQAGRCVSLAVHSRAGAGESLLPKNPSKTDRFRGLKPLNRFRRIFLGCEDLKSKPLKANWSRSPTWTYLPSLSRGNGAPHCAREEDSREFSARHVEHRYSGRVDRSDRQ